MKPIKQSVEGTQEVKGSKEKENWVGGSFFLQQSFLSLGEEAVFDCESAKGKAGGVLRGRGHPGALCPVGGVGWSRCPLGLGTKAVHFNSKIQMWTAVSLTPPPLVLAESASLLAPQLSAGCSHAARSPLLP